MKHEFLHYRDFIIEAHNRGLQIITYPPNHDFPVEEGDDGRNLHEPVYVGIRQQNPAHFRDHNEPRYIDIIYGLHHFLCTNNNHWEVEAFIFDSDDEYQTWENEQMRKAFEDGLDPKDPQ